MATDKRSLVCVIDDDAMVRESLRLLLEALGMACSAFGDCRSFLESADLKRCHCLILDVRMPGISGTVLQEMLQVQAPYLPIIFISGHGDIPLAVEAMRKGAVDFMQKPFNEQLLLDRVQKAIALCQSRLTAASKQHDLDSRLASLTPREREVLDGILAGLPNKRIATQLDISIKTVEQHRARAMGKLGARNLADLFIMLGNPSQR
ncbi:MAG: LuxR family transcriptional regulator [Proteobacteria bacterium]|nr:LuxR family transcriptional regulator [Pseudomonadota bacterium]